MAAVPKVYYDFGGSDNSPGTEQDTSALSPSLRFKTADDATIDVNNPIPIPAADQNYSYWKQIYLKFTTGPSTQINNVKLYSDGGGFGTGITLYVGDELPTHNSGATTGYDVATGTEGTTGDTMSTGANQHTDLTAQTDMFSYTSGSPKSITISESGNVIDANNETTNYVVLQMKVASTASPGNLADETLTWQYDEI